MIENIDPPESRVAPAKKLGLFRSLFGKTGCRSGAVTVETAIVILPFLFLTLMTMEVILIGYYQSIFAKSFQDTARQIRLQLTTSQSTTALQLSNLVTNICNDVGNYSYYPLPNCVANTAVIVNHVTSGTPTFSKGISGGALVASSLQTDGTATTSTSAFPTSCNLVVFQAFYRWPILIPINRSFLNAGFTSPSYLFATAAVFKDEVPSTGPCPAGLY